MGQTGVRAVTHINTFCRRVILSKVQKAVANSPSVNPHTTQQTHTNVRSTCLLRRCAKWSDRRRKTYKIEGKNCTMRVVISALPQYEINIRFFARKGLSGPFKRVTMSLFLKSCLWVRARFSGEKLWRDRYQLHRFPSESCAQTESGRKRIDLRRSKLFIRGC